MIEQFVKQLLQDKGLPPNLEPAVYDQLIKDLTERVTDLINRRLIDAMSDDQASEFDKLLESQPDNLQAAQAFIDKSVPDKNTVVAASLSEFRQLYLGAR